MIPNECNGTYLAHISYTLVHTVNSIKYKHTNIKTKIHGMLQ